MTRAVIALLLVTVATSLAAGEPFIADIDVEQDRVIYGSTRESLRSIEDAHDRARKSLLARRTGLILNAFFELPAPWSTDPNLPDEVKEAYDTYIAVMRDVPEFDAESPASLDCEELYESRRGRRVRTLTDLETMQKTYRVNLHCVLPLSRTWYGELFRLQRTLGPFVRKWRRGRLLEACRKARQIDARKVALKRETDTQAPTGIIIDGRGVDFTPHAWPEIHSSREGALITHFAPSLVSPETIKERSYVRYAATVREAREVQERVGAHPLVVPVAMCSGDGRQDLILNAADAGDRLSTPEVQGLFTTCRVIIVLRTVR